MVKGSNVGLQPAAVNPATAARLVSVSRSTIYRWMEIPGFPVFRVGGCVRIPVYDLLEWMRERGSGVSAE